MKFTSLFSLSHILFILCVPLIFSSCNGYKALPYMQGIDNTTMAHEATKGKTHEAKIMPNDIISITVNSNVPGAATDFNLPMVPGNLDAAIQTNISTTSATTGSMQNYLVDTDGVITFPVLGEINIAGMTIKEARNHLTSLIYPRYIPSKPIINIRFLNYEVSVLGEVAKPGIYNSKNGQITIFDALAAAGDMTIYGKRDNVLLVRTQEDGEFAFHRINLQDKEIALNKGLFYMQQNDKLYIETNKAKGNNSKFGTLETIGLSAISIIISVIAIATR